MQNIITKFLEFLTFQQLTHKYAVMASVGQYLKVKIPFLACSARKNLMFKCLVLLLELFFPFPCNRIVLLLSWYIFCSTFYPWGFINSLVHSTRLDASSAPTNSASVLFFLSFFCFRDVYTIDTFFIVNGAPVLNLKSECTANDTIT